MRSIRSRLLGVAVLAALLTAIPLSLVVGDLLNRSFDYTTTVRGTSLTGLDAGLEASRQVLRDRKAAFVAAVDRAWRPQLTVIDPLVESGLVPLDAEGRRDADADVPDAVREAKPPADGEPVLSADWLVTVRRTAADRDVLFAQPLPPDLVARTGELQEAYRLLNELELDRDGDRVSYVRTFLAVFAATVALTLAVALLVARRAAQPLEELAAAARRVGDGDFTARVDAAPGGEVGDLATTFNAMVGRLERQRRDLARLEKMAAWRNMARVLAHEIKNPLTPILLAVQETRRGYRGDDDGYAKTLDACESIVTEEVEGLRNLVRSFSDFARVPQPDPEDHDVKNLVDDLARLYGDRLAAAPPAEGLRWRYDAGQLRRALVNLIDNGLTACRRAGRDERVEVGAAVEDGRMVWIVADRGDGIPDDHIDRVFEPDFTTGDGGMGLGLPIVAGIVEGHGGRIDVTSSADGTRFTVTLPIDPEKETVS